MARFAARMLLVLIVATATVAMLLMWTAALVCKLASGLR